jgi:hypothetical protein
MRRMTIEMLQFVDVILKMIVKGEKDRINVEEVVKFV